MSGGWRASVAWRQAAASVAVLLVAALALALVTRALVLRQERAALLATIDTDLAGLADGMAAGGRAEVARRIADRAAFEGPGGAAYRLADAGGRWLAGDLPAAPALDPARSAAGEIATAAGPALARATRLRGGETLVVARELAPARALAARLGWVAALVAMPAAALVLAAGGRAARRQRRRIVHLNQVFDRFAAGDRAARAAPAGPIDELGLLATRVDAHLARTARLIDAQREISDNIAHELRTPLGHLDARLRRALAADEIEATRHELHGARVDIRGIVALFDVMLDLALAEADDGAAARATSFDLSDRLRDLAELYTPSAEEAGLRFSARIAPGLRMRGEPMAMSRAVANLLDNAFRYTRAGDHVRLTLAAGPRIVVEDDGPGVAPADRERIFERFRGTRGDARHGHGLGLALVRVIAARHGLVARCEDAAPGARFVLAPAEAA